MRVPCLFGAVGSPDAHATYDRIAAHFTRVFGSVESRCWSAAWIGAHAHAPSRAIGTDREGRTFAVYGERDMYRALDDQEQTDVLYQLDSNAVMNTTAQARGNLVLYDPRIDRLALVVDWVSFFPLYYTVSSGHLLFSSHLKPLATATQADVDLTGVAQSLTQNWCLNGRTVFKGIRRLLPGQSLVFRRGDPAPAIHETSRLWTEEAWKGPGASVNDLWQMLCASASTAYSGDEPVGLMMSGGWDSRVLLAAYLETRGRQRVTTFAHGDPRNSELRIVRHIADGTGLTHVEVPLGNDALGDAGVHDDLFDRAECLLFPYWRLAAQQLRARGVPAMACGLLGEILGGHYTVRGGDAVRVRHYVRQVLFHSEGRNGHATVEESFRQMFRSVREYRRLWYLKPEVFQDASRMISEEIEGDIDQELKRYQARGTSSPGALLQAYVVEHRALMMLANLPLTSHGFVDVQMPFADRRLISAALSMSFDERFERSLCQRLLRRHRPELLDMPLAATMWLPARAPMLLHQGARLMRRGLDLASDRIALKTRGRLRRTRRFGWMNFDDVLRSGQELQVITDSLRSDVFDRSAIARRIDDIREYRSHVKLGHVYLKMAWLDRMMRSAN
jgi:asparagine synthetase B (glutamine-hydrolysing)